MFKLIPNIPGGTKKIILVAVVTLVSVVAVLVVALVEPDLISSGIIVFSIAGKFSSEL